MRDAVLDQIQSGIQRVMANSELKSELTGWKRTVLVKIGRDCYTLRVANGSITAAKEKPRQFDVEIRVDKSTFMEIALGKLPFTTAYLRGLLNVKGDVQASDITRLQKLL